MLEMVMVARGLPSRASKKAWQNDDKREAGAVFSRPEGGGKHKKRFKAMVERQRQYTSLPQARACSKAVYNYY
jgi:hypothetical protein